MGALALVGMLVSVAATAYGEYSKTQEEANLAKHNQRLNAIKAQEARNEATVADYNAQIGQRAVEQEIDISEEKLEARLGEQRSLIGKGGVAATGSLIDVELDLVQKHYYDIEQLKYKEELDFLQTKWGGDTALNQSLAFAGASKYEEERAKREKEVGRVRVGSSLLAGLPSIASRGA